MLLMMALVPSSLFMSPVSAVEPSWDLIYAVPSYEQWVALSASHYQDTAISISRRFTLECDVTDNFGSWDTNIKLSSYALMPFTPTHESSYKFFFTGTSKNTETTVTFGWYFKLIMSYRWFQWYHKYQMWRVDQYGAEDLIFQSESTTNYAVDIFIQVSRTPSSAYCTKITTNQIGNPVINTIFDYIENPTLIREYEYDAIAEPVGVEGWSTEEEVLPSYDCLVYKAGEGTVEPSLGLYRIREGGFTPEFWPTPADGWYFNRWQVNGEDIPFYIQRLQLQMFEDKNCYATFYRSGAGGCPLIYTYNGSAYVYDGMPDIHDPGQQDITVEYILTEEPVKENGFYKIRFSEYPTTISHLDQVKLYGILPNGQRILLPMTSAIHNVDGNVIQDLRFSDDIRVECKGIEQDGFVNEEIDFLFSGIPEEYIDFVFVVEGHNFPLKV